MTIKKLYRGVNKEKYDNDCGRVIPKINTVRELESFIGCGDSYTHAGQPHVIAGKSNHNILLAHQLLQKGYPTSCISTTPHYHIARSYAFKGEEFGVGYIIEFDVQCLEEAGVGIYRVADLGVPPSVPEDDEHILYYNSGTDNEIPESTYFASLVEEYEVLV